ncbi:MAG: RidA family protein [Desulfitobacteriia bacterium]|jgi:2-iminobutanoate/2-iminopropanoate deaminase
MEKEAVQDNYLFFSSEDLIHYFMNNLAEKDLKTQTKRIMEMAKVFMAKKGYDLEDIYSLLVMLRDMDQRPIINEVIKLYFNKDHYPIRVIMQIGELENTADLEIEFSAYKGEKRFINSEKGHLPTGPYSQAVVVENYVHCSGVRPVDPLSQKLIEGDCRQKTRRCLDNLEVVLQTAGTGLDCAYAFMVYLTDLELLPQIEEVFAEYNLDGENVLQEVTKVEKLNEGHELEISCSAFLAV